MKAGFLLGIEGGGTRTVALVTDFSGALRARFELGPGNLRLLADPALGEHFRKVHAASREFAPMAVGIGLAGCRDATDRHRVSRAVAAVWPGVPVRVDHDLETAWRAAAPLDKTAPRAKTADTASTRIVVVSGTGSCCYGRRGTGPARKLGGWGHWLGDHGSGYELGRTALCEAVSTCDLTGRLPAWGPPLMRQLALNRPDDLIAWAQDAAKADVAALAPVLFASAAAGDPSARRLIRQVWSRLLTQATTLAQRLGATGRRKPGIESHVDFVLCGSVFLKQRAEAAWFGRELRRAVPRARVRFLERESAWGAVALALEAAVNPGPDAPAPTATARATRPPPAVFIPGSRQLSPTEERNPRSERLDQLSLTSAIDLMLAEEGRVPAVIGAHRAGLARLIRRVAETFRKGNRLFYVGAGTSGRLGVLDASECPPTFRTSPDQVQGIMAGGVRALHSAVEGAEDDGAAGADSVRSRNVRPGDVVLGIAASGRTPFVWGALAAARAAGATTALLCFNPHLEFPRRERPDLLLALDVGPEVLTGSTRLKAGTATKLVLNLITTLAMVQTGKVVGNLMVDLNPSNVKLRDRAVRIVVELAGVTATVAGETLRRHGWLVADSIRELKARRIPPRANARSGGVPANTRSPARRQRTG